MAGGKMHEDELQIEGALVRELLAAQFPQWADLAVVPVISAGTDNALFRLGADIVVRMPRVGWAASDVEKECRWLPRLAPHLPLAIPLPIAMGMPANGYPWRWSVCRWLEGEDATQAAVPHQEQAARDLARFLRALQQLDTTDGPLAGSPDAGNTSRAAPLATRDCATREAIARLDGVIEVSAATALWEAALRAPTWSDAPVWIHGDLSPLNLLVRRGRLSAVIDFGTLAVGDPAVDLVIAWNYFSSPSREVFRAALGVEDATWLRGLGWALTLGLGFAYYEVTNPVLARLVRRTLDEALADWQRGV